MEGFLYYCRVVSKDAENFYENMIYITSYSIPKDIGVSKCNLHLLWVVIIFGFVIMNPNAPNLGYYLSYYKYFITSGQTMCIKSILGILVIIICTFICFHVYILMKFKVART